MTLDRQAIAREGSGGAPVGLPLLLWFLIKIAGVLMTPLLGSLERY